MISHKHIKLFANFTVEQTTAWTVIVVHIVSLWCEQAAGRRSTWDEKRKRTFKRQK